MVIVLIYFILQFISGGGPLKSIRNASPLAVKPLEVSTRRLVPVSEIIDTFMVIVSRYLGTPM